MRFVENGPDIPNELLEARDAGSVVFLCGAGVSMPAGLPGFNELTASVSQQLGADLLLAGETGGTSFDQHFNGLCRDFGRATTIGAVRKNLRIPKNADLANHAALLRLSSDLNGSPRIITTNFDSMFERPNRSIKRYVAPELPDLRAANGFTGLVYLHGRISASQSGMSQADDLIISSADFGRAYLALGWAANFVRELLQRYTVVLVGYSADDPPVRYLLEGLDLDDHRQSNRIYAFAPGDENEARAHWLERNVEAITYPVVNGDHSLLWDTIAAWAKRAGSPSKWKSAVVDLGRSKPSELSSVQRGQVCSLISSADGASAFANAEPKTHPAWVCVFDPEIRLGKEQDANEYLGHVAFSPRDNWGLDSDPLESHDQAERSPPSNTGMDFLSTLPGEFGGGGPRRLRNQDYRSHYQLPPRLWHLTRWIASNLHSTTTLWWAARQSSLHPELLRQIKWELEHLKDEETRPLAEAWQWLLHAHRPVVTRDGFDDRSYALESELKKSGWNFTTRAKLEELLKPRLTVGGPIISSATPPDNEAAWDTFVRFEMAYPNGYSARVPEIPDAEVTEAFRYARWGLEYAAQVISATGQYLLSSPTFYPEGKPGTPSHNDYDTHLLWVGRLFSRLCNLDAELAKREFKAWPQNRAFFDKLKLHALSHADVFTATDVFDYLIACEDEAFWEFRDRRDLLILLRDRWASFSLGQRKQLLERLLHGPATWQGENKESYNRGKAHASLASVAWLRNQGCKLPSWVKPQLSRLAKRIPDWKEEWANYAADSHEGWGGTVSTNTEFANIRDEPLSKMAEAINAETRRPLEELTDYRPFKGIVRDHLTRAISFLGYEGRCGRYPAERWREALDAWPEDASARQLKLFAHRLADLPQDVFLELRHSAGYWLSKKFADLASQNEEAALRVWDRFFQKIKAGGDEATRSGISEISRGSETTLRSRRTLQFATGPVSDLTEIMLDHLSASKPDQDEGLPLKIRERLESLMDLPGEGADHATCLITRQVNWLEWIDPAWVDNNIISKTAFDNELSEPVWNGLLRVQNFWSPRLFKLLKSNFLNVGRKITEWNWDGNDAKAYSHWVVVGCWWNLKERQYLSWAETRRALKEMSDEGRRHAIWTVSSIVRDHNGWKTFGRPFFEHAWPKELRFRSSSVSYNLIQIAENAHQHFPDVVQSILPHIVPMDHPDLFVFKMKKSRDGEDAEGSALASIYPTEVLSLLDKLIPVQQQVPPYDLASLLELIANAQPSLRQDQRWLRLGRQASIH